MNLCLIAIPVKMNNSHILFVFFCFMNVCFYTSGQKQYCQEFIVPHYAKISDTCWIYEINDSTTIVSNLFKDKGIKECAFIKKKECIILSINGQQGIFYGNEKIGSWVLGEELTRFTIRWDSMCCINYSNRIYEFEFVPYYSEQNPYIDEDGIKTTFFWYDNTKYFWTVKDGVIAIWGDLLLIRKDKLSIKECMH